MTKDVTVSSFSNTAVSSTPNSQQQHQRGMTDEEIRIIFEQLYQVNDPIRSQSNSSIATVPLNTTTITRRMTIVPCGPQCEKLSPPPITFPNGLYVLLRPTKVKRNVYVARTNAMATTTTSINPHATNTKLPVPQYAKETPDISQKQEGQFRNESAVPMTQQDTSISTVIPEHLQQYPVWDTTTTTTTTALSSSSTSANDYGALPSTRTIHHDNNSIDNATLVCKWRLSGPQFPQPTAIQQRYCYPMMVVTTAMTATLPPQSSSSSLNEQTDAAASSATTIPLKNNQYSKTSIPNTTKCMNQGATQSQLASEASSYCDRTGGALYTMYCAITGKELLEYRLLHVYYSSKRAGNKGIVALPPPPPPLLRPISTAATLPLQSPLQPPISMKPNDMSTTPNNKTKRNRPHLQHSATTPMVKMVVPTTHKRWKSTSSPAIKKSSLPPTSSWYVNHNPSTTSIPYYSPTYAYEYSIAAAANNTNNCATNTADKRSSENYQSHDRMNRSVHDNPRHCPQQTQHFAAETCNYEYQRDNDAGRSDETNVFIPTTPPYNIRNGAMIGVVAETPPDHQEQGRNHRSNFHGVESSHGQHRESEEQYCYHSPSPFRRPICIPYPPINIRNISPLYSSGRLAAATLNDLDQYELSLAHSPSMTSTTSSLLSVPMLRLPTAKSTNERAQTTYFDFEDDKKAFNTSRDDDVNTVLSFTNGPFSLSSYYDDAFDDITYDSMNIGHKRIGDNGSSDLPNTTLCPKLMETMHTAPNENTIQKFQSTLEYVQERIREHIVTSSNASFQESSGFRSPPRQLGELRTPPMSSVSVQQSYTSGTPGLSVSPLIHVVTEWARHVAQHPLQPLSVQHQSDMI
jgi:hypothetical protein